MNIIEILKECPIGTKLYSTLCGECTLYSVTPNIGFSVLSIADEIFSFSSQGKYTLMGECCVFPTKDQRDWSRFQVPVEFKDGDIISNGICTAIYNGNTNDYYHGFYVGVGHIDIPDHFIDTTQNSYFSKENTHLATEEEKEKLFKAIENNGYKWNKETKTLEKLIVPSFKIGDRIVRKDGVGVPMLITKVCDKFYKCTNCKTNQICVLRIKEQDDYELTSDKFDPTNLKLYDKVLVWDGYTERWNIDFFGRFDDNSKLFKTMTGSYSQCIPFENNEHLFDTNNECSDYYKTWEE